MHDPTSALAESMRCEKAAKEAFATFQVDRTWVAFLAWGAAQREWWLAVDRCGTDAGLPLSELVPTLLKAAEEVRTGSGKRPAAVKAAQILRELRKIDGSPESLHGDIPGLDPVQSRDVAHGMLFARRLLDGTGRTMHSKPLCVPVSRPEDLLPPRCPYDGCGRVFREIRAAQEHEVQDVVELGQVAKTNEVKWDRDAATPSPPTAGGDLAVRPFPLKMADLPRVCPDCKGAIAVGIERGRYVVVKYRTPEQEERRRSPDWQARAESAQYRSPFPDDVGDFLDQVSGDE